MVTLLECGLCDISVKVLPCLTTISPTGGGDGVGEDIASDY